MRKPLNQEHIEGRVYEHNLSIKQVKNSQSENFGKDYIGGTIDIATDEDCLNIVQVNFTYVTPTTKEKKPNATYTALKNIIESGKTVVEAGKDEATIVKIDTALGLNDFYTNRNGEETLVSAKRNDGGFVTIIDKSKLSPESARNTFKFDMLINGTQYVEADEEKNIKEDYLIVKGAIFNFRKEILPVQLKCTNPGGMKYFDSLDASDKNIVFTNVWGSIITNTIVTPKVTESAFGDPEVTNYTHKTKDWLITGTLKSEAVYEIGDEEQGITIEEIQTALKNREIYLADVKRRNDEYQTSKAAAPVATASTVVSASAGGFNF